MLNFFFILYLSFMIFVLWSSIMLIANFMGLFFMLRGGFGYSCCCRFGGWSGLFGALGIRFWLFEMYFGLNVRACGYLVQGLGSLVRNLGGKTVVQLFEVRFFLVWMVLCDKF